MSDPALTPEPTPTPAADPAPAPTPAPAASWRDDLRPDLKDNPSVIPFLTKDAAVEAYVNLKKHLGSDNKIAIPDQHATDQDWRGVFTKLGLPEESKYEVKAEGADPEFMKDFVKTAHEAGILPRQFQKVVDKYLEKTKTTMESQALAERQAAEAAVNGLKKELGQAYDQETSKAKAAFLHYSEGNKEIVDFLNTKKVDGIPLASHPQLVKVFMNVAKTMKEGTFKGDAFLGSTLSPEAAMQKANSILSDPSHPYRNRSHPNHDAAVKEVSELFQLATPAN